MIRRFGRPRQQSDGCELDRPESDGPPRPQQVAAPISGQNYASTTQFERLRRIGDNGGLSARGAETSSRLCGPGRPPSSQRRIPPMNALCKKNPTSEAGGDNISSGGQRLNSVRLPGKTGDRKLLGGCRRNLIVAHGPVDDRLGGPPVWQRLHTRLEAAFATRDAGRLLQDRPVACGVGQCHGILVAVCTR